MKQVADKGEQAMRTVLTVSSFKANGRECSGIAPEGHEAAVLTHEHTNKPFYKLSKMGHRYLSGLMLHTGKIQIHNEYLCGNVQCAAKHVPG